MDFTKITYDICRCYLTDLESDSISEPLRQKLLGYVRSRNLPALCDAQTLFDAACHSVGTFRALRQVEAFFKKNSIFVEEERCSETAASNFLLAEKYCRITNRRLTYFGVNRDRLDPDIDQQVAKMEAFIERFLTGPHKDSKTAFKHFLDSLPTRLRVTDGATSTRSRRKSRPFDKLGRTVHCTAGAKPYLEALRTFYGYKAPKFKVVNSNRVEFVPKNWKTHRTIACEPTGNVPLQLAFDEFVKEMLPLVGCNLHDQVRNQQLAKEGSISGKYATIDLSMASDTVSAAIVPLLFPHQWADFLEKVRSPVWEDSKGEFHTYSKFSSMGNGSTFAIETVVFAAACWAVGAKVGNFVVYGDDIIIPTELADKLTRLLNFLGFRINRDKSYSAGPFRESCGSDWFNGVDVTPFYLRKLDSRKAVMSHNVNGLASIIRCEGALADYLANIVRELKLPFVPYNYNTLSGVFIDPTTAYNLGLFRNRRYRWTPKFKAYLVHDIQEKVWDSRTLFLYHLDKARTRKSALPRFESYSKVPTLKHKFVREWVGWYPPSTGIPVHLYWWTDYLVFAVSPERGAAK